MSPGEDSTAKSSSSWPTTLPSGSAVTEKVKVSGMAPPLVSAVMRTPRRPFSRWFTRSRCRCTPLRPRRRETPSESVSSTAWYSSHVRSRYG